MRLNITGQSNLFNLFTDIGQKLWSMTDHCLLFIWGATALLFKTRRGGKKGGREDKPCSVVSATSFLCKGSKCQEKSGVFQGFSCLEVQRGLEHFPLGSFPAPSLPGPCSWALFALLRGVCQYTVQHLLSFTDVIIFGSYFFVSFVYILLHFFPLLYWRPRCSSCFPD